MRCARDGDLTRQMRSEAHLWCRFPLQEEASHKCWAAFHATDHRVDTKV